MQLHHYDWWPWTMGRFGPPGNSIPKYQGDPGAAKHNWLCQYFIYENMTIYNVENGKINASRITSTLLANNLPYFHMFLQVPVDQLKRFWRRSNAIWMRLCPCLKGKSVDICCTIKVWGAMMCVCLNVNEQSSTWKPCCVQCPVQTGAVHVELLYCAAAR